MFLSKNKSIKLNSSSSAKTYYHPPKTLYADKWNQFIFNVPRRNSLGLNEKKNTGYMKDDEPPSVFHPFSLAENYLLVRDVFGYSV